MGAHGDGDPFGKKWNIGIIGIVHPMVNYCNSLQLKMAIEIVDLPSYKMVIFHSYVSLPEAISHFQTHTQVAMFRVTALGNEAGPQKTV